MKSVFQRLDDLPGRAGSHRDRLSIKTDQLPNFFELFSVAQTRFGYFSTVHIKDAIPDIQSVRIWIIFKHVAGRFTNGPINTRPGYKESFEETVQLGVNLPYNFLRG